ncbi:MAG: CRISPR system precrRNA processing endoribonuclease RAMP protein Cas6 [Desulfofustis sp. PB-SRB1]|jgi:hypothetical protein|nr:CRISPR system precrRNA processing endoribonuclease RAMP protein Cas6 [Desulfofustis sp. PB-SRB1]HBH29891.1 CRISPR system precrRNA processing endoribonuclease RAMP protein Cas6 [Desulfofustis sp.]HBH32581.1 CRISPR system precrRNA processing endoribonuclease RAMP protein Cas6 [Desulfofustis sp.]
MRIGIYRFTIKFTSPALLPSFKGSTLRGGLGHSLKRVSCALRRQECHNCMLRNSCAYARIFEPKPYNAREDSKPRIAHRPLPYVIEPPLDSTRHYDTGAHLEFRIILFGNLLEYIPYLVFAVQEMGKSGLGKKQQTPGLFELKRVHHDDTIIYEDKRLSAVKEHHELVLDHPPAATIHHLTIQFPIPFRVKHVNKLQSELPFHVLMRAAVRRYTSLEHAYGDTPAELDFRAIINRAESVATECTDCRWQDIERYSNRQQQSMYFGGICGTTTYRGDDLAEFIPLLKYCETTHVGKQTAFGLGMIRVSLGESS